MNTHPTIGIILINYKDYATRFLIDCRDSFRALEYPKDKLRIYIVDNATSPESQAYLKATYPEAIIIPNAENSGWGGGNNRGMAQAFKDGCEDIVFSNMDVIVDSQWLQELVNAAYSDSNIGIVQSKLFLHPPRPDGTYWINSLGNRFHYLGFGMSAGGNAPDGGTLTEITDINYASGSAMYVKGPVIKKLGTFEENFFMYHDDIEYSFKARQAGYRIIVAPKSIMYHKHEFSRSIRQFYYMERNRFLTLLYFYKIPTLILIAPMFVFMEIGQWLYALKNGMFVTRLRVYGYFLNPKNLAAAFKRRAELQAQRVIKKDKDFVANFVDKIEFQEVSNPLLDYVANPLMHGYWQIVKKVIVW